MSNRFEYRWTEHGTDIVFAFVRVRGTLGQPYMFGDPENCFGVEISDFFISNITVTQGFWKHVMGRNTNPSIHQGDLLPVENVSWDEITSDGGFLDRLNQSPIRATVKQFFPSSGTLRLPTETEWEYAARGGMHWRDGFRFSGSDDISAVAWCDRKHGDHTQPVALKQPNQLGIFDMSGNVWEWCQDAFTANVDLIPVNGTAFESHVEERVLRGGCFHNWPIHCTVSKRYAIGSPYRDGCIGLRLVFTG